MDLKSNFKIKNDTDHWLKVSEPKSTRGWVALAPGYSYSHDDSRDAEIEVSISLGEKFDPEHLADAPA